MKILLAIDGSPHSEAAIADVARRSWPDGTAIEILSVMHASAPLAVEPAFVMAAAQIEQIEERRRRPTMLVNAARDRIEGDAWGVQVTTKIVEGDFNTYPCPCCIARCPELSSRLHRMTQRQDTGQLKDLLPAQFTK